MTRRRGGNEGALRWSTRLLVFSMVAGLQSMHLLPVSMLLLPLLTEVLLAMTHDRVTPVLISAISCYVCVLELPPWLMAGCVLWCLAPAVLAWIPIGNDAGRRGAVWSGVSAGVCAMLLVQLGMHFQGHGIQGVAEAIADRLSDMENIKEWLYQLTTLGVLPLKASPAELATMRMFGSWGMSLAVKEQLLSSLMLLLSRWLTAVLPTALIMYCGGTGILCAAIPDAIRAEQAGYSDLPPMRNWVISRSWTPKLAVLLLPSVLAWLTGEAWLGIAGGLCMGLFQLAMGTQGICVLLHMRHKLEVGALGTIMAALLALMMSRVLVWVGIIDQFVDFRGLREAVDDDDNDDMFD